jgi:hypothetical protein
MGIIKKIGSVTSEVLAIRILENLEEDLKKTDLSNLKSFNHSYLVISKNVCRKMDKGNFSNKNSLQKLDINFANYYFKAISDYENEKYIPKAWEQAFKFFKKRNQGRFVCLILAANAHINNDLPLSLAQTVNKDFYGDFQKVEEIIHQSTPTILNSIDDNPYILVQMLHGVIVKFFIKRWRRSAWENYLKLKSGKITKKKIENDAEMQARIIIMLINTIS